MESFKEQKWVDDKNNNYVVRGHPGVYLGRENIMKNNYLFEKYSFCLVGEYTSPSKEEIQSLILSGRGKLLSNLPPPASTPEEVLSFPLNLTLFFIYSILKCAFIILNYISIYFYFDVISNKVKRKWRMKIQLCCAIQQ